MPFLIDRHNRASISSHFRDIGFKAYWGQEFDRSGSRDVIGHVTVRFPIA